MNNFCHKWRNVKSILNLNFCYPFIHKSIIALFWTKFNVFAEHYTNSAKKNYSAKQSNLVPLIGLEPIRAFGPRDFKSLASTYSATSAHCNSRLSWYFAIHKYQINTFATSRRLQHRYYTPTHIHFASVFLNFAKCFYTFLFFIIVIKYCIPKTNTTLNAHTIITINGKYTIKKVWQTF